MDMPKQNTDKELFREVNGDYYSPASVLAKIRKKTQEE